jgi:hypothetical protein
MNYHTALALFKGVLADHLRLMVDRKELLFSGIGIVSSMGETTPEGAAKRLELVRNAGLPGAVFFNKTNVYAKEFLEVFRRFAS